MKRKEVWEIEEAVFQIDMNNGFCNDGNLADPTIKEIAQNIIREVRKTIKKGEGYIVVNDRHTENSVELKRYDLHCIDPEETKTIKELAVYEEYATGIFYKNSTCALFAPGMMEMLLHMKNLKRVKIVGCLTDVCVANFAMALRWFFDEHNMDVEIIVIKDCVQTFNAVGHDREEYNQIGYKMMENNGIKLTRQKEGI